MKYRKFIGAVMIAGAVSAAAVGCGGDEDNNPLGEAGATTEQAENGNGGAEDDVTDPTKRPTVDTLNEMLTTALDPDVPNSEKAELVEGADRDPEIFDRLVQAQAENPDVDYVLLDPVVPAGAGRATVKVEITLPDSPPTTLDAQIVFDDGRWKLASDSVCPLLAGQEIQSPMCAS